LDHRCAPCFNYLPEFKDLQVRVGAVPILSRARRETVHAASACGPMTVQDLLRHTAGLVYPPPDWENGPVSDGLSGRKPFSTATRPLAEMVDEDIHATACPSTGRGVGIQRVSRCARPGSSKVVSGKWTWIVLSKERVTKPMGMTSTRPFYVREAGSRTGGRANRRQIRPSEKRPPMFDATQKPKFVLRRVVASLSTASRLSAILRDACVARWGKLGDARLPFRSQPSTS